MHPLVELAKKEYFTGSHLNVDFVQLNSANKVSEEFRLEANKLVRNFEDFPHAFVLAYLMDSGIDADKAWSIPYKVFEALGIFEIQKLYEIPLTKYIELFNDEKSVWHRYPTVKAKVFFDAIHKIVDNPFMNGDASRIWTGKPTSGDVIHRFLDFNGCGFKIANMCPNLLNRYFGIEFSEYSSIDIVPDVHTVRVFQRLGLTPKVDNFEIAKIYTITKAREINPNYPGIVDGLSWNVGRNYCDASKPDCSSCPLNEFCEKKINGSIEVWK